MVRSSPYVVQVFWIWYDNKPPRRSKNLENTTRPLCKVMKVIYLTTCQPDNRPFASRSPRGHWCSSQIWICRWTKGRVSWNQLSGTVLTRRGSESVEYRNRCVSPSKPRYCDRTVPAKREGLPPRSESKDSGLVNWWQLSAKVRVSHP